jgi:hypothetical protein
MDGASRIFDDLFLGSEWNASNLEELERNGIGHILNVTVAGSVRLQVFGLCEEKASGIATNIQ